MTDYRGSLPLPPPGFDPTTAPPERLDEFGIPRRPNPENQPHLLKAWKRLFRPPIRFVEPKLRPVEDFFRPPEIMAAALRSSTRIATSRNWSGASIVPHDGAQFVACIGGWEIPTVSLPAFPDQQLPPGSPIAYTCSTWIGLDGNRRYRDSSLPQIGTLQSLATHPDGTLEPVCSAFFQWWHAQEVSKNLEQIGGLAIRPELEVMALIWAIDPTQVVAIMRTFEPFNEVAILAKPAPSIKLDDGTTATPRISGATAEWITERPRNGPALVPFPAYDGVDFTFCVAGTAITSGPASGERVLDAPRLLRMLEVPADAPSRTRLISTPLPFTTPGEVSTRYVGL